MLTVRPAMLDRDVSSFGIAGLAQTLQECCLQTAICRFGPPCRNAITSSAGCCGRAYAKRHRSELAGHQFLIGDFSTGRPFNFIELIATATQDYHRRRKPIQPWNYHLISNALDRRPFNHRFEVV